jgi:hypothetical protein
MLKKIFLTLLLVMSFSAFACWKVEGTLAVDGETWKIHQKFDHQKEYVFPMGSFILKLTLRPQKKKDPTLVYTLHEKKGVTLTLITKGEEKIKVGKTEDIYAKGEEGQPHSIITIKLTNI